MNSKQIFARWKAAVAFVMVLFAAVFMTVASLTQPVTAASSYSFKNIHGKGKLNDTRTLPTIMEDVFKLDTVYMNFDKGWSAIPSGSNVRIVKNLKNASNGNKIVTAVVANADSAGATWSIVSHDCFSYFDKSDMSKKKGNIRFDFKLNTIKTDGAGEVAVAYINQDDKNVLDTSAFWVTGDTMSDHVKTPGVKETVKATFLDSDGNALSDDEMPSMFWGFYDIDIWDKYTYGGLDSQKNYPRPANDGTSLDGHPFAETVTLDSGFANKAYRRDKDHTVYMTDGRIFPTKKTDTENDSMGESAAAARIKKSSATIVWTGSCCSTGVYSMSVATVKGASATKEISADGSTWKNEVDLGSAGDKVYYRITINLPNVDHDIDPTPYSSISIRDRLDWLTKVDDVNVEAGSTGGARKWTAARIGNTRSIKFTYNDVAHANELTANEKKADRKLFLVFSTKTKTVDEGKDDTSVANPNDEDPPAGDGKAHTHPKNYKRRKSKQKDGKTYRKLYNKAHVYLDSDEETTPTVNPWVPLPITQVNIVITKEADDSNGVFGDGGMNVTRTGAIYEIDKVTKVGDQTTYTPERRHGTFFFKTNAADDAARPPEFTDAVLDAASPPNPHPYYSDNDPEGTVDIGEGGTDDAGFGVGTYRITELHAPNGFFNATGSKQTQTITITQEDVDNGETKYVTFSNPRPVGKIHIQKLIPDSGCTKQIKNYAGNTFAIYAAADIINPRDGSAKYSKDHLMTTITTDSSGDAYTGYLPMGSYYAVETGVAKGLLRNRTTITGLNLSVGDWVDNVADVGESKATHTNYPTLTRFRKTNELTNTEVTTKGLAGATLEVKDNGQVVASGQTDASGIFTVSGLDINHTYTVHEAIPAPHYTAAPDQQFTTTTQTETDGTQIVGINTQWYDNWCDYGYGYTTPQATGTRIIDVPEYLTLRLYKRIDASDPWISNEQSSYGHGEPTFLFRISGTDFRGQKVTYYRTFTFTKSEIDNAKHTGWLVHKRDVKVRAGTYTVTEVKSMRYKVTDVFKHTNATVNSDNQSADVDLHMSNNNTLAEVGFTNRTTNYNDWSHTSTSVNAFKNSYVNSDSTHKPVADEADETEDKVAS